jgi:hypothetical protein
MANVNRLALDKDHNPVSGGIANDGSGDVLPLTIDVASGGVVVDNSGGGSGGTQYASGTTTPGTVTGNALIFDDSGTLQDVSVSNPLPITGTISVGSTTDNSSFTAGTSTTGPTAGVYNDSLTALSSGKQGTYRATAYRGQHVNLRNNSGAEIGTSGSPVYESTVNGALETGGNLATLAGTVSSTKVNVNISSGNITGFATSTLQTSGGQKTQIVDGSDTTIPSTTATTVGGNVTGLNVAPITQGADYYPGYNTSSNGGGQLSTDPAGALITRGATLTDEGTFRINFANSSLYTTSTNQATFTNGSPIVTFASSIEGTLIYGSFIALSSDGGAYTTIVGKVINATTLELGSPYEGSSATGNYIYGTISESLGSGASLSVASGQATLTTGTTSASQSLLYGPGGAALSYLLEASFSISARNSNQDIYMGFEASPFGTITQFARFHFSGSGANTTVITETGFNPTQAPSSNEIESYTLTLPSSATTATLQTYRMIVELDKIYFFVNGNLIQTHTKRLPRQQDFLYQGATFGIRTLNGTSPSSANVVVDYMFLRSYDRLDSNILTTAATANGANNSATGTLLGAGIVGQYNSSLPTVTSGSYYTSQLDSSARQIIVGGGTAGTPAGGVVSVQGVASGTALPVSGTFYQATQPVSLTSTTITGTPTVQTVPATSGGIPTVTTGSIGNTATSLKSSAGQVYAVWAYNNNSVMSYIQFFNTASGSVTVGTTAPIYSLGVPPNSGGFMQLPPGYPHSTAIVIAITTTRAGATSPSNTVDYNVWVD